MIRINRILFLLIIGIISFNTNAQLAFPSAEGYGRYATGGRGDGKTGRIVEVTNLDDDPATPSAGSLRWALKQGLDTLYNSVLNIHYTVKRPLTVVFRVGGVINLKDELRVDRDNLTIAGQTAPGDGICIRGATVNFSGSTNVIVRYMRFRPGDELGEETSAFRIENGGNFIIDHCSFSWAIEETTHFSSNENTTVQWCIISESLYNSIHKKGERGYATQWGGEYASYHHNLLAHHNSRMPRINGSNKNDIEALVDYRNNVNYNWGSTGAFYGGEWEETNGQGFCHTNVVNNYFIPGPATLSTVVFARPSYKRNDTQVDGYAGWYFDGNIMEGYAEMTTDNWQGVDGSNVGGIDNIRSDVEFVKSDGVIEDYDNYTQTAEKAKESVFLQAGAIFPVRDTIDKRIIAEAKGEIAVVRYIYTDTTGQATPVKGVDSGIIDTQRNLVSEDAPEGTTAWDVYTESTDAPVDLDHDGMDDAWEIANGLNPNNPDDRNKLVNSGYTCLEVYLNSLVGENIELDTIFSKRKVHDFVVAKDGSGDFTSINEAIDSVPEDGARYTIFIKKGTYEEKVFIGNRWETSNKIISLIGENVDSVIVVWDDYHGKEISYPGREGTITADGMTAPTMTVTSPNFYMENITVKNPSTEAQAEALYQAGDKQILKNCKILGNQDTHRTKKTKRYFYFRSTFEGDVDFIYAGGTCYFYQCDIVSNDGGYITAPEDVPYYSTLSSGKKLRYGFFFKDCDIIPKDEDNLNGTYYLGRPWQSDCGSVFLNSRIGNHIDPEGWRALSGNESSASFAEYRSMNAEGTELADVSNRVDWSIQLTTDDVNNYMLLSKIFAKVSSSNKFDPIPSLVAPDAPENFSVKDDYLSWSEVNGAIGYVIYANGSVIGFNNVNQYTDTLTYETTPVYTVKAIGELGNLSADNGQSEDFTEDDIREAIDTEIVVDAINEMAAGEEYLPKIINGQVWFDTPVELRVFNITGQELVHRQNSSMFLMSELGTGVFIFRITDEKKMNYSFKVVNAR